MRKRRGGKTKLKRFGIRRFAQSATLSVVAANFTFVRVLRTNRKGDSATRGELRGDDCFARRARFDEIVQDAVRDCFVERVLVSIRRQIKLKRLAFDAETIGYVIDIDLGEIRLPSNGTNGSEIICLKMNAVIAVGRWILEGLKPRFCGRSRKFRVAVPEQC